jgi:ribose transport system permease protein
MKKLLGMVLFLVVLYIALLYADPNAGSLQNHYNLGKRIGFYGILCLGSAMLIITGGIDLSLGSVVGLGATLMAILLVDEGWSPWVAMSAVLGVGAGIGVIHGLLVTKLKLQAFVVTLCGLFIYRGAARWIAGDTVKGLGALTSTRSGVVTQAVAENAPAVQSMKDFLYKSDLLGIPKFLVIFLILCAVATVFLHFSVYGRYFFAIGSNERAARYSGIATERYKILAYVLCSVLASFCGVLFLFEHNSAQPSETGSFFELYAIAGAVLGGCSLRGGEGSVFGVLIGTTILWILPNLTKMWGIPDEFEYMVIGGALLLGAILDELLRPRKR